MHQRRTDQNPAPEHHLDQEWRLFESIESGAAPHFLHLWESSRPAVVVGRSQSIADHVVQEACRRDGVPVLRRRSGGGAVVLGPGCLNYALGFSLVSCPLFQDVPGSFRLILGRLGTALAVPGMTIEGGTDLVLNGRKVSGNAQRRGRRALLHHGTLLYGFDPGLAARYLKEPGRQPAYRAARAHHEFIGKLPMARDVLEARLAGAFVDRSP